MVKIIDKYISNANQTIRGSTLLTIFNDQKPSTTELYEGIFHTIINSSKDGIIFFKNGTNRQPF